MSLFYRNVISWFSLAQCSPTHGPFWWTPKTSLQPSHLLPLETPCCIVPVTVQNSEVISSDMITSCRVECQQSWSTVGPLSQSTIRWSFNQDVPPGYQKLDRTVLTHCFNEMLSCECAFKLAWLLIHRAPHLLHFMQTRY